MHKTLQLFSRLSLLALLTVLVFSCTKEDTNKPDDTPGAIPDITLSVTEATSNGVDPVTTELTINAPEGLKQLNISKNGTELEQITFNFERTKIYTFSYLVESRLMPGVVIQFTFEAVDSLDRKSAAKVFNVTVGQAPVKETVQVNSDISTNTTFTADKIYRLNGLIKVNDGATLEIKPGTVVLGASDSKGGLLVLRGGKLIADGTAQAPIIFTSDKPAGSRAAGDWKGITICGKAPNNIGNSVYAEFNSEAKFGGTVSDDNSGILRYVRIEFAGEVVSNNKEYNALTLASVGSTTIIDHVQVSYALDDSFEFFGGTVNAKNLVSFKAKDDDFDFDNGHSGNIQFALAIRDASIADQYYSNGIEIDNDFSGSGNSPATSTVLSNVTIIGAKYNATTIVDPLLVNAAHIRRNSMPSVYNSYLTGFPVGIFMDDTQAGVSKNAMNNDLQIRNVILAGVENWGDNGWGGNPNNRNAALKQHTANIAPGFEINAWFGTESFNNTILPKWQNAGYDEGIYTSGSPVITPSNNSMLLTSARWDNTPKAGSFFEQVTYAGAAGTTDWTTGWGSWDPQNAIYE